MSQPPSDVAKARARLILGALLAVVVGVGVLFYITVWDTPESKCRRGDLGACIVWELQADHR